jgi:hypothetical protein
LLPQVKQPLEEAMTSPVGAASNTLEGALAADGNGFPFPLPKDFVFPLAFP